ncbi:Bug family tripartite tricarboxylate transporter substrate binding protein [Ottowia thiooxydans]|uniref:Tripartite-type tricarboxylate transporter receptor subunit TctC n=1 Tax=Ottowia thiooxydans TaxID=219182 RepID=A0ABV2QCS8_9BURK
MMTKRKFLSSFAITASVAMSMLPAVQAQDLAGKPITLVVPFSAGSSTDAIARLLAQLLGPELKTTLVIDNKPGAGGLIAAKQVASARPDGTTIFITTNTTHAANQFMYKNLPYDPVDDFTPVSLLRKTYQTILVRSDLPAKSVAELVDLAKRQPGKLTFGSGSASSRMGIELLKQLAGVEMLHVPYKSNPHVATALMGAEVDVAAMETAILADATHGKFRPLAVTSDRRLPHLKDLPTVAESGLKSYEMSSWTAVYLPKGASPQLTEQLQQAFVRVMNTEPMAQHLRKSGSTLTTSTPQELAKFQAAETEKWGRMIRAAGIQPE